jgi:anti-sigma factor RsiW
MAREERRPAVIDEKLLEQLSCLLDNQLPAEERRALEEKIQNDPAVRAEWEALRQFSGMLSGTAPAPVQAPVDFRARILDRLQDEAPHTVNSKLPGRAVKGASGGGLFFLFGLPAYAAVGVVLAGLVGTMAYLDLRQAPKRARQAAPADLSALVTPQTAKTAPEYRGTQTTVSAGSIEGSAALAKPTPATALDLQGGVYSLGQGSAQRAGGVSQPGNASLPEPAGTINLDTDASRPQATLDSSGAWTQGQVKQALAQLQVPVAAAPQVMNLAQKNHLNPGLLCAALAEFPHRSAEELALDLRTSLNASVKLPEDARLKKCVQDLGGVPAAAGKWKKYLQP